MKAIKFIAKLLRDAIIIALTAAILLAAIAVGPPAVAAVLLLGATAGTFFILP